MKSSSSWAAGFLQGNLCQKGQYFHKKSKSYACSLSVGCRSDRLQVLHHAPVARSLQPGSIPEGLGLRRAGLVIQDLNGIHVFVLAPNVLVHHQWRQAGPHNGSHEGAQLDHVALAHVQPTPGISEYQS